MKGRPTDPAKLHWIVLRMSKKDVAVGTRPAGAMYYRHSTQASAENEAARLAAKHPGKRFSVYERVESFKVEKPTEDPTLERNT